MNKNYAKQNSTQIQIIAKNVSASTIIWVIFSYINQASVKRDVLKEQ